MAQGSPRVLGRFNISAPLNSLAPGYPHRSRMTWANSLALSIKSLTRTRSSAPWRWVSKPGRVQPKATPPGISWT